MTFRRKLLSILALTVTLAVAAVALLVMAVTRSAFEKAEDLRTAAMVTQFQREFTRRGEEVAHRVERIAASDAVGRMAVELRGGVGTSSDASSGSSTSGADSAEYFDLAHQMAEGYQLDFLEFLDGRGTIISSAQWPAKFGYPDKGFENPAEESGQSAFLKREELQDSTALGLFAVRATNVGEHPVYVVGGRRIDKDFLTALDLPAETRVLLYQNRSDRYSADFLLDPAGNVESRPADKFKPIIEALQRSGQEMTASVHWTSDEADDEEFHAIPLRGAGKDRPLLGVLLVGNSRRAYVELKRRIGALALLVGGGGIILAVLVSSWAAGRVTRPVVQLARAAQEVAAGHWDTRVEVASDDEVGQMAESFNRMTAELLAQKERLVQTERVAAWRELARRLAHELKNPLFPLQLTVENLMRARAQSPEQFDEVFNESSRTLLGEIANLKTIIGRFSDFSKMPHPQLQAMQVNEVLRGVVKLFQAQLQAPGRPAIACRMELDERVGTIMADPDLIHRAISNLVLNAMDAMQNGGTLTLRSRREDGKVMVQVADTGSGMTPEECERIFTPYYTSKQHGTGLGLAIVQSVVSDHGGTIKVQSEPGRGTTFVIELPENAVAMDQAEAGVNDGRL